MTDVSLRAEATKDDVADKLNRGASKIGDTASAAGSDLAADMRKLREDIAAIQQTMAKFATSAGNEAYKTAQSVGASVANQVGGVASDVAHAASQAASSATEQAKTMASELEGMARRNPLGTIGASVLVGVVIGMMSRGTWLMRPVASRLLALGLDTQVARLRAQFMTMKDRALDEAKSTALDIGTTMALAAVGLVFMVLTLIIGLMALYVYVGELYGPMMGLAAAGGTTLFVTVVLFLTVAVRAQSKKTRPKPPQAVSVQRVTTQIKGEAAAAGQAALNQAADVVRKGSPQAILGTVAAAVVVGLIIGRRT